jgi:hypothetical protein
MAIKVFRSRSPKPEPQETASFLCWSRSRMIMFLFVSRLCLIPGTGAAQNCSGAGKLVNMLIFIKFYFYESFIGALVLLKAHARKRICLQLSSEPI